MLAYVELIQRKEKEIGCDVLTHQKWSGASYIDRILAGEHYLFSLLTSFEGAKMSMLFVTAVSAGSSATAASGKESTEGSFH